MMRLVVCLAARVNLARYGLVCIIVYLCENRYPFFYDDFFNPTRNRFDYR
jgi:hypothetical protein